jgi:hypothetical protein
LKARFSSGAAAVFPFALGDTCSRSKLIDFQASLIKLAL